MLSLLMVLALDGRLLEELARRGPVITVEEKAPAGLPKGFFDAGLRTGIVVQNPRVQRPATSAGQPDCPIRLRTVDPAVDAGMTRYVNPPVDAFMAVPGRCNARGVE